MEAVLALQMLPIADVGLECSSAVSCASDVSCYSNQSCQSLMSQQRPSLPHGE